MKRREIIKGLGALGILSIIPGVSIGNLYCNNKRFHFVGLGSAGANILNHIRKKGIDGKYSSFNWYPSNVEPHKGVRHLYYEYPRHLRQSNELGKQCNPLTAEMKKILSDDRIYIVIAGLGAYSGTSLISDTVAFLESNNKRYLAICTLPFKNEGRSRNDYAREKRSELEKYKNVRFFDNNCIYKKYGEDRISSSIELSNTEIYRIFEEELPNLRT